MSSNLCPVCGCELDRPAWDGASPSFQICPCCGIQFGYQDFGPEPGHRQQAHEAWRKRWIEGGMAWWSVTPPPAGWTRTISSTASGRGEPNARRAAMVNATPSSGSRRMPAAFRPLLDRARSWPAGSRRTSPPRGTLTPATTPGATSRTSSAPPGVTRRGRRRGRGLTPRTTACRRRRRASAGGAKVAFGEPAVLVASRAFTVRGAGVTLWVSGAELPDAKVASPP
jgi:hypothetical protein